ncbi:T cell receptor alpha chain MC.7.G5-like [Lepus europaeus]|uniref:T cell receptor alpha chain MC.7.G5-like n=1 Tax=Lepus europaeus TaxID=9983 RepID=UPI002B48359A|nr:T cell receptor alpha chain MC.7.G5-like [Lepus europaeus]
MKLASLLWAVAISTCLGSSVAQTVTQTQPEMSVQEAETATLDCTYDTSDSNYYLFWYKQPPSGELALIIHQEAYKPQNATQNRFSVNFQKASKSFSLKISDSQLGDAGMYLCALQELTKGNCVYSGVAGNQLTFGKGTKLSVTPNITDPQPAVYQLRNSKSSDLSLCLLTDFDSKTNVSRGTEPAEFITSQTVLNMKSLDSKSYGALAWSQKSNFSCSGAFNESNFLSSSDVFCNAKLVEKSFETDMNLNFQNLSVIGLRLLLLKVAGFNLLMTLRLWSS